MGGGLGHWVNTTDKFITEVIYKIKKKWLKADKVKIILVEDTGKFSIGNEIITCLNMAQARARRKKGAEAAEAVISVLSQK